ncbi:AAA family ATPase [uncultured Tateyamaria sp.]|uniref:AAA family ATPase n=1 Tax=uncultured Tateyamaria sp. TaxID=455651 RepID=UPI0026148142|nr:ATP-binding protein [uncultured Tateyamaria sp.]
MKPVFVKTQNYNAFQNALKCLNGRGAEECVFVVVDGEPGLGKTTILSKWAAENSCIYMRAKTEWSATWFMGELLDEVRVPQPHRHEARFKAALQALGERALLADQMGQQFAVVVDEADHVSSRKKVIETMRDLADLSGVPFILVGMGKIRDNLTKFPQIASRVSAPVRFATAKLPDVEQFLAEKCEVPVAPCLANFVLRATGGYNREIKEAIQSIERFGLRVAPADPEVGLTLREMAGQHLINDRKSGYPIKVPGVEGLAA